MKNWRTTLVGGLLALLLAIQPLIEAAGTGDIDWKQLAVAGIVAVFSYLSKDAGVSGTQK